jgi:hypothetical protein
MTAPARPAGSPTARELAPIAVTYNRAIRPNWSDEGFNGRNLDREVADCLSRPELLDDRDVAFLTWLRKTAVRGERLAFLSPFHARRLKHIVARFTEPMVGRNFLLRQAEKAASISRPASIESVDDTGKFVLTTCNFGEHIHRQRNAI